MLIPYPIKPFGELRLKLLKYHSLWVARVKRSSSAPTYPEMYNVKGPSKIVAKTTRRGIQNLDSFRDHSKPKANTIEGEVINDPKPIFQNTSKKSGHHGYRQQEVITPQHEELIIFIGDSWNSVYAEINSSQNVNSTGKQIRYYADDPSPQLQTFKPFDLEGWWGKRLFNYITNSVNHKG